MKGIIIAIAAFWLSWHAKRPDYISFEYSGNSDKDIDMIFISKKPLAQSDMITTLPWTAGGFNYVVNEKDFNSIKKAIANTPKQTDAEYYGYKIVMRESDLSVSYFVTRKNSENLWNKMLAILKQSPRNNDLIPALRYLGLNH